jgi:hypothetical protein
MKIEVGSRNWRTAIATALLISGSAPAFAQEDSIDLGQITCKDMMLLSDRDREAVMAFYFGYTSAKESNTVLDLTMTGERASNVIDDCLANSADKAMDVFSRHGM